MLNLKKFRKECNDPYHLIESKDGTELFLREWTASKPSQTAFIIFHGITAHSEPYEVIGKPLADKGYTTYGFDLRGHGLSGGPRGDYESVKLFYEDVKAILDFVKSRHDSIVLLGHSLGVVSSVMTAKEFEEDIDGLVLLSAAREVKEGAYPKRSIFTTIKYLFWSIIKPSKPVIHYYREGIRGLEDPRFNFYYTLRFLKVISAQKFSFPENLDYPVYVGVGEDDELFSVEAARDLYDEVPSSKKTFGTMPNAKHAYFGDDSFNNLLDWIGKNFKS